MSAEVIQPDFIFDEALVARCRRLISKLHGEDKDCFQERLDRYLVAASNAVGPDAKTWTVTAIGRGVNLKRYVEEEEAKRRERRR